MLREGIGLTNAAPRTTRGSGDLRRADFAGAAERLERLALELRPGWIAFVGKEAYRGTFNERPELGPQKRRLGETRLFVLPSTSPANAAVPWEERLRWFQELARSCNGRPMRQAVRALVVDSRERVLLLRYDSPIDFPQQVVWAPPGGGLEPGETDEQALRRELAEETGLVEFEVGPCIWTREHRFAGMPGWGGQRERIYLVRVEPFEPAPGVDLAAEDVAEVRWWTADELAATDASFAPRSLPRLICDLRDENPAEPIDAGVSKAVSAEAGSARRSLHLREEARQLSEGVHGGNRVSPVKRARRRRAKRYPRQRLVIGVRRSRPNAFGVERTPGGACRRLYSARSISASARSTTSGSKPSCESSSRERSCST